MSRIGKKPIPILDDVTVTVAGHLVTVKGPKGELQSTFRPEVAVTVDGNQAVVSVVKPDVKEAAAYWGLTRQLLANMITGVKTGFEKKLEINGVGYKVALQGQNLNLSLGYSHPVTFVLPANVTATVDGNTITLVSIDKQLVGQVAADIRKLRKPEPYKGKGIKYSTEVLRRKAGKAAKSA